MRIPLMSPELVRGLVVAEPVCVHVLEELGAALVREDGFNVGYLA